MKMQKPKVDIHIRSTSARIRNTLRQLLRYMVLTIHELSFGEKPSTIPRERNISHGTDSKRRIACNHRQQTPTDSRFRPQARTTAQRHTTARPRPSNTFPLPYRISPLSSAPFHVLVAILFLGHLWTNFTADIIVHTNIQLLFKPPLTLTVILLSGKYSATFL